jgi:hypothetical protein
MKENERTPGAVATASISAAILSSENERMRP